MAQNDARTRQCGMHAPIPVPPEVTVVSATEDAAFSVSVVGGDLTTSRALPARYLCERTKHRRRRCGLRGGGGSLGGGAGWRAVAVEVVIDRAEVGNCQAEALLELHDGAPATQLLLRR